MTDTPEVQEIPNPTGQHLADYLRHTSLTVTKQYVAYKPKVQEIPNLTGQRIETGNVKIGDTYGWFVRCDESTNPLPRLLHHAAEAVASSVGRNMGETRKHAEERHTSTAKQLRSLAAKMDRNPDPAHPRRTEALRQTLQHTSLAITEQYAAAVA